ALLGSAVNNLGLIEQFLPTWRRSEAHFREAISSLEAGFGPSHSRPLRSRRNLILALGDQGRHDEALEETRLALRLAEQAEDQLSRARVWETAGIAQRRAGLFAEAVESQERCRSLAAATGGPSHPATRKCLGQLAWARALDGDEAGAIADLERLRLLESEPVSGYAERAIYATLLELARFDEAEPHIGRYRELTEGRNDGIALFDLARVRQGQGANDEARRFFEESWLFFRQRYGPDHALALRSLESMKSLEPAAP
ncbi:MAG: tetratricopeptide repeat protein, partial [Acidobacteriota bacterium]